MIHENVPELNRCNKKPLKHNYDQLLMLFAFYEKERKKTLPSSDDHQRI
jgi:hypothetical protein